MGKKTKKKTIEQSGHSGVRKGSPMERVGSNGRWRKGFKEKVSFEFRMEKTKE